MAGSTELSIDALIVNWEEELSELKGRGQLLFAQRAESPSYLQIISPIVHVALLLLAFPCK
jgi:hypothetical protein